MPESLHILPMLYYTSFYRINFSYFRSLSCVITDLKVKNFRYFFITHWKLFFADILSLSNESWNIECWLCITSISHFSITSSVINYNVFCIHLVFLYFYRFIFIWFIFWFIITWITLFIYSLIIASSIN